MDNPLKVTLMNSILPLVMRSYNRIMYVQENSTHSFQNTLKIKIISVLQKVLPMVTCLAQ